MRQPVLLSSNEIKVLTDALQFLSKSQQKTIERSHHTKCGDLYLYLGHELGRISNTEG
jgi:hypothetical protein